VIRTILMSILQKPILTQSLKARVISSDVTVN
jgi:hypothetical protein